jgi:hypothetical protein
MGFILVAWTFPRQRDRWDLLTDNPETEVWFRLSEDESEYAVRKKMLRYYDEEGIDYEVSELDETVSYFVYSLKQGREYFSAAKGVSILTRPLLLFYGMVCLAKLPIILKNPTYPNQVAEKPGFRMHGLAYRENDGSVVENDIVKIREEGTFSSLYYFVKEKLPDKRDFKISELYGWLPDMFSAFGSTSSITTRLATVNTSIVSDKGDMAARIALAPIVNLDEKALYETYPFLKQDFEKRVVENETFYLGATYENRKKFPADVGTGDRMVKKRELVQEIEKYFSSISRYNYLSVEYLVPQKEQFVLNPLLSSYMLMYGFSRLCRYNPAKWGKLIEGRTTNERWLVERFIDLSRKTFPWEILQLFTGNPVIMTLVN